MCSVVEDTGKESTNQEGCGTWEVLRESGKDLQFQPYVIDALRNVFEWFDSDQDGALDFEELAAIIKCTEGETLTRDFYSGVIELVETNSKGSVTFNGFLKLYYLNYDDTGVESGDTALRRDLKIFGYDCNFVHNSKFPDRAEKRRNAFALLGKGAKTIKMEKKTAPKREKKRGSLDGLGAKAKHGGKKQRKNKDGTETKALTAGSSEQTIKATKIKLKQHVVKTSDMEVGAQVQRGLGGEGIPVHVSSNFETNKSGKKLPKKIPSEEVVCISSDEDAIQDVVGFSTVNHHATRVIAPAVVMDINQGSGRNAFSVLGRPPNKGTTAAKDKTAKPVVIQPPVNSNKVNSFFAPRPKKAISVDDPDVEDFKMLAPVNGWELLAYPPAGMNHVGYCKDKVVEADAQAEPLEPFPVGCNYEFGIVDNPSPRRDTPLSSQVSVSNFSEVFSSAMEFFDNKDASSVIAHNFRDSKVDMDTMKDFALCASFGEDRNYDIPWADKYAALCFECVPASRSSRHSLNTWLSSWLSSSVLHQEDRKSSRRNYDENSDYDSEDLSDASYDEGSGVITTNILVGPYGSGKTSIVHSLARKVGFNVIEINPGNLRSAAHLTSEIGEATQSCVIGSKGKSTDTSLILVDEVDTVFEEDKGFHQWVRSLVHKTKCPVIVTCNLVPIALEETFEKGCCQLYHIDKPKSAEVVDVLKYVCTVEGISASHEQVCHVVQANRGDIRQCLNHLQFFCRFSNPIAIPRSNTCIDVTTPTKVKPIDCIDIASPVHSKKQAEVQTKKCILFQTFESENEIQETLDELGIDHELGKSDLLNMGLEAITCSSCGSEDYEAVKNVEVHSIVPRSGCVTGGTVIRVSGVNLCLTDKPAVYVGGVPCPRVSLISDTVIEAVTPPCPFPRPYVPKDKIEACDDDVDEIEDPDEGEYEFGETKTLEDRIRESKEKRSKKARIWPCDIHVEFFLGERNVTVGSSMLEPEYLSNGLFLYVEKEDTAQTKSNSVLEHAPSSFRKTPTLCKCNSLQRMSNILDCASICENITCPRSLRSRPMFYEPDYWQSRVFEDPVYFGELSLIGVRVSASLYECTFDTNVEPGERSRLKPFHQPEHMQGEYFQKALGVLKASNIPLSSFGPSTGPSLVNSRYLHPVFLDYLSYILFIVKLELSRKSSSVRRRFLHHFKSSEMINTAEGLIQNQRFSI
uniref:EF-hand domain-containing protein n=1 Tax=Mucochytrium quahogii TaxID=96639 RepID=A0A7S2W5G9_9STRA|mmetsp:Transcript_5812/g.10151  ORF Transcript_5812/g.10151 Transcript_5812/m.10151 type:complete len:1195 (-) Transcript_5812:2152-5736(-)